MNVGQICTGSLVKVAQNTPVSEVARLMTAQQVGAVIVTAGAEDRSPLVGIITDRDIVNAQLDQARDLGSLSAEAVMTRKVLTLAPQESIDGAIAHMRARSVRRAPVVTAGNVPVGMISTDDLIAQMSFELFSIAGIVAKQSAREA
jgi:CBS domain-containing protein